MPEAKSVNALVRREAAQMLADFALHLKRIADPDCVTPHDVDRALGAVVTPILKPAKEAFHLELNRNPPSN